ncbi:hypothetical protein [Devosia sp. 919]|uniref:hypothetical protein n=1 Tax=Devosia sp. 919 TaxID=2726065 RepID=UPI001554A2A8|nr:hypothetical protein [Devosia sp. 919]
MTNAASSLPVNPEISLLASVLKVRNLRSRPMRCFLVGSSNVDALHQDLRSKFDEWHRTRKADSAELRQRRHDTLELLVLNLIVFSWSDKNLWVQTPANKTWYTQNGFWLPKCLSKAIVLSARDFLVAHGYAEADAGRASSSPRLRRSAVMRSTKKLADLASAMGIDRHDIKQSTTHDLIHLKSRKPRRKAKDQAVSDPPRRRLPFEVTPDLQRKIENLTLINQQFRRTHIDIKLTPRQEREMMAQIIKKQDQHTDLDDDADLMIDRTQDCCYRVYNNGTFEEGGRFYGPWWQSVPKESRKHIMINGKRTVELDYSSMHPTILGNRLGIAIPQGFYEIGIGTKKVVKQTFNALLNAKGTSIKPVDGYDEAKFGMPWSEFLKRVKTHYAPFKSYFGKGEGLKLQRIDSDIAEAVMLHFAKKGKTVLPVHDSFLCTEDTEHELAEVMEAEFHRQSNGTIKLKDKRLSTDARLGVRDKVRITPEAYAGYFNRKTANLSMKRKKHTGESSINGTDLGSYAGRTPAQQ